MMHDFPGHESLVAAVAVYMRDHGITPAQVLAEYDTWIAEHKKQGATTPGKASATRAPGRGPSRAGSTAQLAHACPRCGGNIEMQRLCPRVSPHWRTQLACMRDECAWHGLSTQPIAALLSGGAAAIKKYVNEG